jgi:hypothetical protein
MKLLTRHWFSFGPSERLTRNAGVTAYSLEDAYSFLRNEVFPERPLPEITEVIENVDVSTLDENHILPNIGSPSFRGVWYPNLNSR